MRSRKELWLAVALGGLALSGGGCQKLIGLEERKLAEVDENESDAGQDGAAPAPALCDQYCDDVLEACSGGNDTFVSTADYGSKQVCLDVCAHFPEGDPQDVDADGHTLACRAKQARLAKNLNALEKRSYCPAAGPGGGSPAAVPSCGSNCEAYCQLYQAICPDQLPARLADPATCVRLCEAIPDTGAIDANRDFAEFPDTIQCRLAHLSVAAFDSPAAHCVHARLVPEDDDRASCDLAADQRPNCEDYCRLIGVACTGELAVYESPEQCMSVCAALPPGTAKEIEGNSLACRRRRAYAALLDPEVQCGVAGPVGAPCGEPCQVYCELLEASCGEAFAQQFAGGAEACRAECETLGYDGRYGVAEGTNGDTLECRLLHLSQALAGDANACESAAGQGDC